MAGNFHSRFRFAMLGLSVTALFVVYQMLMDVADSPHNPGMMLFFVVLCPPSLISALILDAEIGTRSFYFVWAFIGVLNAVLYGAVATLIARRKRPVDSD